MKPKEPRRLLLIDDDPLFGKVMVRKAEARGLALDYSGSLVDALYENYLDGFEVAIVDCNMPGVDGFEVAQYLRRFSNLPVILVSHAEGSLARYLQESDGAATFVSKQEGTESILSAAERLLRRRRRGDRTGLDVDA